MEIKVTKIRKKADIPINSECQRIARIKDEIASSVTGPTLCQVEVFDMWEDLN